MNMNRRRLIQTATALGGGALSATIAPGALAADTSGYKALVGVFLIGGIDTHDVLIPYDQASYDAYATVRASLMELYAGSTVTSRLRSDLLPLSPLNASDLGGRQFALGQEASGLHSLFAAGRASIVGNVGPLVDKFTRSTFIENQTELPPKLYSHNDQQSLWMSLEPEGAIQGWGGRFADAVNASNANQYQAFTSMAVEGSRTFLTGESSIAYSLSGGGPPEIRELEEFTWLLGEADLAEAQRLLMEHFTGVGTATRSNLFERDLVEYGRRAIETNALYRDSVDALPDLPFAFPRNFFGRQLETIANAILAQDQLGASRQLFLSQQGGFDTHDDQATGLPARFGRVSEAIEIFDRNMEALGYGDSVTVFTMSDFGRTLTINGDGTDHGWGGHHFVVGGAVDGGLILGDVPPPELEHDWDGGNGALIPTTSIEQYAGALGSWFGLTGAELASIFPRLSGHGGPTSVIA